MAILGIPPHSSGAHYLFGFPVAASILSLAWLAFLFLVDLIGENDRHAGAIFYYVVIILINVAVIITAVKVIALYPAFAKLMGWH
jgi:hypothetical protein